MMPMMTNEYDHNDNNDHDHERSISIKKENIVTSA